MTQQDIFLSTSDKRAFSFFSLAPQTQPCIVIMLSDVVMLPDTILAKKLHLYKLQTIMLYLAILKENTNSNVYDRQPTCMRPVKAE